MTSNQQTTSQLGMLSAVVSSQDSMHSLDTALHQIFKTRQEETRIEKARRIMAGAVDSLTDDELDICLTEFEHLIDYWLDTFEREIFDDKILQQVLMEG